MGWEPMRSGGDEAQAHAEDDTNKLHVLNIGDQTNLAKLRAIFPDGQPRLFHARTPGHDCLLYYVPGNK